MLSLCSSIFAGVVLNSNLPPAPPHPPFFLLGSGEISVLFTQEIRGELGRRRLSCDDGDKDLGDGLIWAAAR